MSLSTNPQVFLSYSRQEMYFAEALAHQLQTTGINMWFDLIRLKPGINWQDAIQEGLETSTAVVLLVSQSSIQSRWVANEWQHAIATGKPLYLVFFEAISLTPFIIDDGYGDPIPVDPCQLIEEASTIIDGRRDFSRLIRLLSGCILHKDILQDAVPEANQFHLPVVLPATVWIVVIGLIILVMVTLYQVLKMVTHLPYADLPIRVLTVVALGGVALGLLLRSIKLFLQRMSYIWTRIALFTGILSCLVIEPIVLPVLLAAYLCSIAAPDVHRYSPRSEGIDYLRLPISNAKALLYIFMSQSRYWLISAFIFLILWSGLFFTGLQFFIGLIILFINYLVFNHRLEFFSKLYRKPARAISYFLCDVSIFWDKPLLDEINHQFSQMGHQRTVDLETCDYLIIPLTTHVTVLPADVCNAIKAQKRVIVLVCSHLESQNTQTIGQSMIDEYYFLTVKETQKFLQPYQWVDYRRQNNVTLREVALELGKNEGDVFASQLSSRTTPTAFNNIMLPNRVRFLLIGIAILVIIILQQLIAFLSPLGMTRTLPILTIILATFIIPINWLARLITREISFWQLFTRIGVVFLIDLAYRVLQNFSFSRQYNYDNSEVTLAVILQSFFRFVLYIAILTLPLRWYPSTTIKKSFSRNLGKLRMNSMIFLVIICIISLALFGSPSRIAIPTGKHICGTPISLLLKSADNNFINQSLVRIIDQFTFSDIYC